MSPQVDPIGSLPPLFLAERNLTLWGETLRECEELGGGTATLGPWEESSERESVLFTKLCLCPTCPQELHGRSLSH